MSRKLLFHASRSGHSEEREPARTTALESLHRLERRPRHKALVVAELYDAGQADPAMSRSDLLLERLLGSLATGLRWRFARRLEYQCSRRHVEILPDEAMAGIH